MTLWDKIDELEEKIWNLLGTEEFLTTLLWYMEYETKEELFKEIADEYEIDYNLED